MPIIVTCAGNIQVTNTDSHTVVGFVSRVWNSFGEYVVTTTPADYLSVLVPAGATVNSPAVSGPNSFTTATGIAEGIESAIWTVGANSSLAPQWVNTDNSKPVTHLVDIQGILVLTGDTTAFGNAFGPFSNVALAMVPSCGNPTSTTVTSSPNPSLAGQSVTFTATVSGSDGGGAVAFTDGATPIATRGAASLTASGPNFRATCTTSRCQRVT